MEHPLSPSAAINKAKKRKPYVATSPSKNSDLAKFEKDPEKKRLVQGPENHSNAILFFGEEGEDMEAPLQITGAPAGGSEGYAATESAQAYGQESTYLAGQATVQEMDVAKREATGWHVTVAIGNIAMYLILPLQIWVEVAFHLTTGHAVWTGALAADPTKGAGQLHSDMQIKPPNMNMRGPSMFDERLREAQEMQHGNMGRHDDFANQDFQKMKQQHAAAFDAGRFGHDANALDRAMKPSSSFVESHPHQAVFDSVAGMASDPPYGWSIVILMVVSIVLCQIIACCGCCGPMRPMGGSGLNSGLVWTAVAVNLVIVILECVRPSVRLFGFHAMTALSILPSLICMTGLMGGYFSSLKK
ncbi:unnamed protein product [Amoebophrya sp. A25]|nr:unnamed protein product [Amoebophrya sp. A25]|eukprot:GSA25T00018491001.1